MCTLPHPAHHAVFAVALKLLQQELPVVVAGALLPKPVGFPRPRRFPHRRRLGLLLLLRDLLLRRQRREIPHPVGLVVVLPGGSAAAGVGRRRSGGGGAAVEEPLERAADDAESLAGACGVTKRRGR